MRSDWNNGNAHFLRGLARALGGSLPAHGKAPSLGHTVTILEPRHNWSTENLLSEQRGRSALDQFAATYPDLKVEVYEQTPGSLHAYLIGQDVVIVHEWNSPEIIDLVLSLRDALGFRALFHDTHHRATSDPHQLQALQIHRFNGVLAFGEALRTIYRRDFGIRDVWTLHEAADTTVFYPRTANPEQDIVWVGNWGDNERSQELREFLIDPASHLRSHTATVYGVRYPEDGLKALAGAGIRYSGYLPNLDAPTIYAASRVTVHIPRQHYAGAMAGIPTIRVFEALASGIPLVSAPWQDVEELFEPGDFLYAANGAQMREMLAWLLSDPSAAHAQAEQGLRTVLSRHTCAHRAAELSAICEEILA